MGKRSYGILYDPLRIPDTDSAGHKLRKHRIAQGYERSRFPLTLRGTSIKVSQHLNRLLIRAAVAHLPRIVEHGHGHDFYCMVSILDWGEFEIGGLICPAFWYTNPSTRPVPADPSGILDYIHLNPPTSRYSMFVAETLDHDPDYLIHDDSETRRHWMRRVYVRLGLDWSDVYQTLR